jgi:catechol 2,3-dioxygenase-like lactoylglutathione lyase family enzyme
MTIRFRSVAPLLQSGDLQRTIDWYESALGFRCVGRQDDW